ncbi:MAG: ABC transporter substrate-binding protein, partial [Pseudomonadota bacterium]
MSRNIIASLAILTVLTATALVACQRKTTDSALSDSDQQTLFVNLGDWHQSLDWNKRHGLVAEIIYDNLMEGLTGFNFETEQPKVVPQLASRWSTPDEGKTWVFQLKKNIVWSDGEPLKAQHFL